MGFEETLLKFKVICNQWEYDYDPKWLRHCDLVDDVFAYILLTSDTFRIGEYYVNDGDVYFRGAEQYGPACYWKMDAAASIRLYMKLLRDLEEGADKKLCWREYGF
jgi:hypothetical protein